jgi:hypothetical protein
VSLGIVGSEAAKFTANTERIARDEIRRLIKRFIIDRNASGGVVSGGCHLGGIDKWSVEEAALLGVPYIEHVPASRTWSLGYRPRNIRIANDSVRVACLTVKEFPDSYSGMKFPYCYHCKTDSHIKSGGCWTAHYARNLGKPACIIVVSEYEPHVSYFPIQS